jgi:hypothetical protein
MAQRLPRTNEVADPAGSTAALWSAKWFGGPTRIQESRPIIQLTPTRILPNNPRRLFYQVINRSAANVSAGFDNSVTVANGIPLAPGAGFMSLAVQEDGEAVAWEVLGIADVAASALYVLEVIRV